MKNRVIRLEAEGTEDREAKVIPICEELYEALRMIPKALHDDHVFLYRGKPVRPEVKLKGLGKWGIFLIY